MVGVSGTTSTGIRVFMAVLAALWSPVLCCCLGGEKATKGGTGHVERAGEMGGCHHEKVEPKCHGEGDEPGREGGKHCGCEQRLNSLDTAATVVLHVQGVGSDEVVVEGAGVGLDLWAVRTPGFAVDWHIHSSCPVQGADSLRSLWRLITV